MKHGISNWNNDNKSLSRSFKSRDFKHAVDLLNKIAEVAEEQNHHPDISIKNFNSLEINITTHEEGGLTDKDYILASAVEDALTSTEKPTA